MLSDDQFDEMTRILEGDIQELSKLAFSYKKPIKEAQIRMMAVLLRRWLVDGDLQKMLDRLRTPMLFDVQGNTEAQKYLSKSNLITYLATASVYMNDQPVRFIYYSPLDPKQIDRSFVHEGSVRLTLKKFLAQPRIYFEGQWFSTDQIIRYVANKLGGNHTDFERDGLWEKLDAANNYFRYGGPATADLRSNTEFYLILEPESTEIIGGVHLEIIAAAASFVQMSINGEKLISLEKKTKLIDRLKKAVKAPPNIKLFGRKKD